MRSYYLPLAFKPRKELLLVPKPTTCICTSRQRTIWQVQNKWYLSSYTFFHDSQLLFCSTTEGGSKPTVILLSLASKQHSYSCPIGYYTKLLTKFILSIALHQDKRFRTTQVGTDNSMGEKSTKTRCLLIHLFISQKCQEYCKYVNTWLTTFTFSLLSWEYFLEFQSTA